MINTEITFAKKINVTLFAVNGVMAQNVIMSLAQQVNLTFINVLHLCKSLHKTVPMRLDYLVSNVCLEVEDKA